MFYWLISACLKGFFLLFYHLKIYGKNKIPKGAAIIAPNHTSFLDPPLMGAIWPEEVHYLARASLFRNPILRFFVKALNAHPVHGSAQDIASFKMIYALLMQGKKVVIFPEGIRSQDGSLQPIKTGVAMLALKAKCPIIPVYIAGTFDAWPRRNRWPKLWGQRITCVCGNAIEIGPYLEMNKKEAQEALTVCLEQSLKHLENWFKHGAQGDPP